jgi:hypothetical protein
MSQQIREKAIEFDQNTCRYSEQQHQQHRGCGKIASHDFLRQYELSNSD